MPDQSSEKDLRLAVLIDADNASRTAMKDVMAEVAVYGTPTIKPLPPSSSTAIPPEKTPPTRP